MLFQDILKYNDHNGLNCFYSGGDNSSTGNEMPLINLRPLDVTNIKESWHSVEQQLVEVGIRVFISLLENQPNIKRTFRKYRSKRHSELR